MKGIWLLPSRRRLDKLRTFLTCCIACEISTPGVILVQKDELHEQAEMYGLLPLPKGWRVLATNGDGLADKCREVFPAISGLDWVGLGCDDLRPQTVGFDQKLIAKVTGRNIVTCDDGVQHENRMSGITVFSGALLRTMGYMFPPHFWHTYVDNVWEEIGSEAECWTYAPDVLVTHDHPFRNQKIDPALADETTYKSYGQQERDIQALGIWRAQEKSAVLKRIREMRVENNTG